MLPVSAVYADDTVEYHDSDPQDYITKNFNVWAEFDTSHTATITEEICVDFVTAHHGITRNIPKATDGTYEIKNVSVNDYKYSVKDEDNNVIIKIGDADKYLTGDQTFDIFYEIEYVKDTDRSADFLAHNMLPTEWQTSIRQANLSITMPSKINWDDMYVYFGEYGTSDDGLWLTKFDYDIDGNTLNLYGQDLDKGFGLTLRDTNLPDGYWSDAISYAEAHKGTLRIIIIICAITAALAVILWLFFGRDEAIIETVEFYPPDNMTPAEIGYAIDEDISDGEMMSTVFYLADKGYITIEPVKDHFVLKKVKDAGANEPQHVKTFLNGLFKGRKSFRTDKVPTSFLQPFMDAKSNVSEEYIEKRDVVFTVSSAISRYACFLFLLINMAVYCLVLDGQFDGIYLAVFPVAISLFGMFMACRGIDNFHVRRGDGIIRIMAGSVIYASQILITLWLFDNLPMGTYTYTYLISLVVIFIAMLFMQKRSTDNAQLMGRIYGFRRFIKDAEYDRIVSLCAEDPEYFYHILPYAAVLGLETKWTKHFENISIPQPAWYRSDEDFVYSPIWCHEIIRSCTKDAVPASPSGGSSGGYSGGSSGGGFSGGGGGGGGGGAW